MSGTPSSVGVVFKDFGGERELQYAGDLAARAGLPLTVYAEHPPDDYIGVSAVSLAVRQRVQAQVSGLIPGVLTAQYRLVSGDIQGFSFPGSQIVVSNGLAHLRHDVSVLAPFDENRLFSRGAGPVMIPLGNGRSGVWSLDQGLDLVKQLDVQALFWHTTWRNPAIADVRAEGHVSDAARAVIREAEDAAKSLGVLYRTVVETVDGVVEGLIRRALMERCVLIVMTRGLTTGRGRYGDNLLDRASPIPLLMIGRGELR